VTQPRAVSGRLDGRAVVVTGATSGIGLVTAARLHAEGARVLATGRDIDAGRQLARSLDKRVRFIAADLTETDAPTVVIDACRDAFGYIDGLVNNAALDHTDELVSTPMLAVRRVFEVNTFAAIAMIQAGAAAMERGGSIVNITSRLAVAGVPTMGVYAASKGALQALTLSAAVELAPLAIRVNDVAPGMTRTPLYDTWLARTPDPARTERDVVAQIPLRRLAVPEDVAAAVAYLMSDDARYVTGTTIRVDGGYTAQ
jgi:NAD(P)-dependent dehydrogenase (short-subunit alcohol dehydrogenase family)